MLKPIAILALSLLGVAACGGDDDPVDDDRLRFGLPILERELIDTQYVGFDHDPEVQAGGVADAICTSYHGEMFPWCYDEHHGSDYMLSGGFATMDAGSATVVAAAGGVVISTHDGEYDRCAVDDGEVSCDGHPMIANHVIVEHEGAIKTNYWHLKIDSVAVAVGDAVACGDVLGLVGSSGNSSAPHLHFQVEDAAGLAFDPYAGEHSQPESWWHDQGEPSELPGPGCTAR